MIENPDSKLMRIGVFYDGNFFAHVSNYYKYSHARKARISIPGLHEFIKGHAASLEGADVRFCHIVDAHFFRGRYSARDAQAKEQQLYNDRVLDDILMSEGVVTHYLPLRGTGEKGIDVWLALEAFELAVYKRFNVLVLIAGDGDFVPLARKVNSLGTRVMVLGWDFKYTDQSQLARETTTSIHLLEEVTYAVMMHNIIDDKTKRDNPLIKRLFVEPRPILNLPITQPVPMATPAVPIVVSESRYNGSVQVLKDGFGFIKSQAFPNNIFFYWDQLRNKDFNDLKIGDRITFEEGKGEKGPVAMDLDVLDA